MRGMETRHFLLVCTNVCDYPRPKQKQDIFCPATTLDEESKKTKKKKKGSSVAPTQGRVLMLFRRWVAVTNPPSLTDYVRPTSSLPGLQSVYMHMENIAQRFT
jgi:hypothetical protein